jgi:hypothetical protein
MLDLRTIGFTSPPPLREDHAGWGKRVRYTKAPDVKVPREPGLLNLRRLLKDTVEQCTYGKDLNTVLAPENDFQVISQDGDVLLRNYNGIPLNKIFEEHGNHPPFKGVCNELAYQVGTYLQDRLGQNYDIRAVRGECDDYFPRGTHYFLVMWPKQDGAVIESQLTESPKAAPGSAFVIDPSFKRVLMPGAQKRERERYRLDELLPLDALKPETFPTEWRMVQEQLSSWIPLGFVKDLLSHLPSAKESDLLLFFRFQKGQFPGEVPSLDFKMQKKDETRWASAVPTLIHLPQEHPLQQLRSKIIGDLARARDLQPLDPISADILSVLLEEEGA